MRNRKDEIKKSMGKIQIKLLHSDIGRVKE
jgi:hypothetical protein